MLKAGTKLTSAQELAYDIREELALTLPLLERMPASKFNWKPHRRSMSLIELGLHFIDPFRWIQVCLDSDSYDFANALKKEKTPATVKDLCNLVDQYAGMAINRVEKYSDEVFRQVWTAYRDGKELFKTTRKDVVKREIKHLVHHRGQLTVYYRLLNVHLVQVYGPTADDKYKNTFSL